MVAVDEETFEDEGAGLACDFPFKDAEDALVGVWDGLELVSSVTVFFAAGVVDAEFDDEVAAAVGAAGTATASGAPDVVVPSGTTTWSLAAELFRAPLSLALLLPGTASAGLTPSASIRITAATPAAGAAILRSLKRRSLPQVRPRPGFGARELLETTLGIHSRTSVSLRPDEREIRTTTYSSERSDEERDVSTGNEKPGSACAPPGSKSSLLPLLARLAPSAQCGQAGCDETDADQHEGQQIASGEGQQGSRYRGGRILDDGGLYGRLDRRTVHPDPQHEVRHDRRVADTVGRHHPPIGAQRDRLAPRHIAVHIVGHAVTVAVLLRR